MVYYLKSSEAIELALLCCSNHHMQIPCTSCKGTAPCQQGAAGKFTHGWTRRTLLEIQKFK